MSDTPTEPFAPYTEATDGDTILDLVRRGIIGAAGLALIVAFFLPWLTLNEELARYSGLDILLKGGPAGSGRVLIAMVPVVGLAMMGGAWVSRKVAMGVGLVAGLLVLAASFWQTLMLLTDTIGTGLWVVAIAALVAIAAGMPWALVIARFRPTE